MPGPESLSFLILVATAIGTSLDAMAVGVSLAFMQVNILVVATAIGAATFLLSSGVERWSAPDRRAFLAHRRGRGRPGLDRVWRLDPFEHLTAV